MIEGPACSMYGRGPRAYETPVGLALLLGMGKHPRAHTHTHSFSLPPSPFLSCLSFRNSPSPSSYLSYLSFSVSLFLSFSLPRSLTAPSPFPSLHAPDLHSWMRCTVALSVGYFVNDLLLILVK